MAREQPPSAQQRNGPGAVSRQRAAPGLHVAEPGAAGTLGERPRDRRELAVQREHGDGASDGHLQAPVVDRVDRVLQARVVELHHVRPRNAVAGQAPREVHVHDVEAAGPQAEIERLHVHDHLVSDLRPPDQRHVGDRGAALGGAVELDDEPLLGGRRRAPVRGRRGIGLRMVDLDHRGAT